MATYYKTTGEVKEVSPEKWLKEYPLKEYSWNNDGTIAGDALIATDQELEEPEETDGEIDEDIAGANQNGER